MSATSTEYATGLASHQGDSRQHEDGLEEIPLAISSVRRVTTQAVESGVEGVKERKGFKAHTVFEGEGARSTTKNRTCRAVCPLKS